MDSPAKQAILELVQQAFEQIKTVTIDGLTAEDADAAAAFGEMTSSIEHAMEVVGYYAD